MEETIELIALKLAIEINEKRGMSTTALCLQDADEILKWLNKKERKNEKEQTSQQVQPQSYQPQQMPYQTNPQQYGMGIIGGGAQPKKKSSFANALLGKKKQKQMQQPMQYQSMNQPQNMNQAPMPLQQNPMMFPVTNEQMEQLDKLTKQRPVNQAYVDFYVSTLNKKRMREMTQPEAQKLIADLSDPAENFKFLPAFRSYYMQM